MSKTSTLKKFILYTSIIVVFYSVSYLMPVANAAAPSVLWNQQFGNAAGDMGIHSVWQTSDLGYIFAGTSHEDGASSSALWLVKTDASGNKQWEQKYNEEGSSDGGMGYSVQQTSDGGYIVAGSYGSSSSWIVKTDANGNKQWEKTYGDVANYIYAIKQTSDGGYIFTGSSETADNGYQLWLVKTDASGNTLWSKNYDGYKGYDVWPASDGGYAVIGDQSSGGGYTNLQVIKTDASGNQQWSNTYDGTDGYAVQQTRDGGYILAGSRTGTGAIVIKLDGNGAQQWENQFEDGSNGYGIQQTWDGGYALSAPVHDDNEDKDYNTLIKMDSTGNEQWRVKLGENPGTMYFDNAVFLQQIGDGSFIVAGTTGQQDTSTVYTKGELARVASDMTPVPNAQLVSDNIPATWEAGKSYQVQVTYSNTGTKPWTFQDSTTLGHMGDSAKFGVTANQTIQVATIVRPGESYQFDFAMTAPAENGTYNPQFQMVWEGHQMFGALNNKTVTVVNGTGPAAGTALPSTQPTTAPANSVVTTPVPSQSQATTAPTAAASSKGGLPCLSSMVLPLLAIGVVTASWTMHRKREGQ